MIKNIQKDKLLHFFVGSLVFNFSMIIFDLNTSIFITIAIAGAKEIIYDKIMNKGNVELLDFLFTIMPCLLYLINLMF